MRRKGKPSGAQAEVTAQEAADILNVSRAFLLRLIEEEKIRYRVAGRHRRILLPSLLSYKKRDERRRKKVLDKLSAEGQRLRMDC